MTHKKDRGLFDEHFRLNKLSKQGDCLEELNKVINWEMFRKTIESAFPVHDPSLGGRPPYDKVMMFKALVIQATYNISDDNLEFQILDRLSFMRFLGLSLADDVPDSKTFWTFREALKEKTIFDKLFEELRDHLYKYGLVMKNGSIVDANIVQVPRQRNSRDENIQIKNGQVPEDWKANPNKFRQKDTDARWTKKNNKNFYGYKNHIKINQGSKLIIEYQVTPASMHDSEVMEDLLNESDRGQTCYADSAYTGSKCKEVMKRFKMKDKVHKKGCRNKELSAKEKKTNHQKSKVRARVEHVFGFQYMNMNTAIGMRYIGLDRIASALGLRNIVYNLFRWAFLLRKSMV